MHAWRTTWAWQGGEGGSGPGLFYALAAISWHFLRDLLPAHTGQGEGTEGSYVLGRLKKEKEILAYWLVIMYNTW